MARRARNEFGRGVYHVTTRGNGGQAIVLDDVDRQDWVALLRDVVGRFGWRCLAWCLMDNHFHLLVETPGPNLGRGMHRLNGRHAQEFNRRHRRSGHLFGERYHATRVERDEHLLAAARYIAQNPVSAGLCPRPEDWRWSSHRTVIGEHLSRLVDVARLLGYFGAYGGDPVRRYREFVADRRDPDLSAGADTTRPQDDRASDAGPGMIAKARRRLSRTSRNDQQLQSPPPAPPPPTRPTATGRRDSDGKPSSNPNVDSAARPPPA